jgi:hypothetical protein
MTIPSRPLMLMESEKAPEVTALVQPNSVSIGLKKTPKVEDIPQLINMIRKAATTII